MAVYYKGIKGTKDCESYVAIEWQTPVINHSLSNQPSPDTLPILQASNNINFSKDDTKDGGHILTDKASGINIKSNWNFQNGITLSNGENSSNQVYFNYYSTNNLLSIASDADLESSITFRVSGKIDTDTLITQNNTEIGKTGGTLTVFCPSTFNEAATFANKVKINAACEATYFNATSDKRAKENIKPLSFSATDFISKLPVYTFNYKDHDSNIVGVLAQDLLKAQEGTSLDLVNNIEATGENGDYMTIKEDKLVYLCMKAIQEQQKEIEGLKQRIKNLSK